MPVPLIVHEKSLGTDGIDQYGSVLLLVPVTRYSAGLDSWRISALWRGHCYRGAFAAVHAVP